LDLLTGALQLQQSSAFDEGRELIEEMRKWVTARVGIERVEVRDLTRRFAMSERGLYRLFARHKLTPDRWLWQCRLEVAKHKLDLPFANITQVALETGFKDVSHFSRSFSQVFGEAPSVYRRKRSLA
jgi:transcriptional regulator GlxA family with amidase domain